MGSFANEPRIDYYAYYSVYGKSILQKTPWPARTHRFSSAMDSRKWKVTIDTPPQDRVVL